MNKLNFEIIEQLKQTKLLKYQTGKKIRETKKINCVGEP